MFMIRKPSISINQGELSEENVSLLPDVVNVEIASPQADTEAAQRRSSRAIAAHRKIKP